MNTILDSLDRVIASVQEVPRINVAGVRALIKMEFSNLDLSSYAPIREYSDQLDNQVNQFGALDGLQRLRSAYDNPRYEI